ncbi:hypothetical protein A5320_02130 [Rheinheimera sp. SA_1]|uniref:hypothetical protein n=1 Tax=Rheinheimera sp. SA_1 TaxID=1827365 RepID=UPI0007FBFED1|nr:hypothetical protein [Rheinheimera sp. SA_1]OBP16235.1 hypothetical protein A5320_02130 [Rheinheimera sp. SA_1]
MNIKNYILLLSAILSSGCSINNKGFPLLYKEEIVEPSKNNLSKQVKFTSFGIHIDTRSGFIINFGYIKRKYIYPLVTSNDSDCSNILDSAHHKKIPSDADRTPIKIVTNQAGLSGEFSPTFSGVFIGYRTRNVFISEATNSFTFYQSNFTQLGEQTCALVTKSEEKT